MLALAIATLLKIINPTPHHYTTEDFAANMPSYTTADLASHMLYTSADLTANMPYTTKDWENATKQENCQCLTLKISPDGTMVVGLARPCACDE